MHANHNRYGPACARSGNSGYRAKIRIVDIRSPLNQCSCRYVVDQQCVPIAHRDAILIIQSITAKSLPRTDLQRGRAGLSGATSKAFREFAPKRPASERDHGTAERVDPRSMQRAASLEGRRGGHHLSALVLDEIRRATAVPLAIVLPRDNRLRRAVALMTDHKGRLRRLEDLATQVGASSRTLARHFKTETGLTFRQWRQHAQIAEAMGALTTGTSPARAAARVDGWQSEQ
jgi:AraC-like DNA-binding protein